jgi:hypothetical protein
MQALGPREHLQVRALLEQRKQRRANLNAWLSLQAHRAWVFVSDRPCNGMAESEGQFMTQTQALDFDNGLVPREQLQVRALPSLTATLTAR